MIVTVMSTIIYWVIYRSTFVAYNKTLDIKHCITYSSNFRVSNLSGLPETPFYLLDYVTPSDFFRSEKIRIFWCYTTTRQQCKLLFFDKLSVIDDQVLYCRICNELGQIEQGEFLQWCKSADISWQFVSKPNFILFFVQIQFFRLAGSVIQQIKKVSPNV